MLVNRNEIICLLPVFSHFLALSGSLEWARQKENNQTQNDADEYIYFYKNNRIKRVTMCFVCLKRIRWQWSPRLQTQWGNIGSNTILSTIRETDSTHRYDAKEWSEPTQITEH